MSAVVHEEAATDEVVALASVLAHLPHAPGRAVDEDEALPVVDNRGEGDQSVVQLLPRQRDEFMCRGCFLVAHVSRRAALGDDYCADCG